MVRDFIIKNKELWSEKKIFVMEIKGFFSGAGCSARLFRKYGAKIIGGLHVKMPDCIGDVKVLNKSLQKNKEVIKEAERKVDDAVFQLKNNNAPQEGLGVLYHIAGLFCQRLWFYNKTKDYSKKLKVDKDKCVACGKCIQVCPMNNLQIKDGNVLFNSKCTMCYRCISNCPKQVITLIGKEVVEQCKIERYL